MLTTSAVVAPQSLITVTAVHFPSGDVLLFNISSLHGLQPKAEAKVANRSQPAQPRIAIKGEKGDSLKGKRAGEKGDSLKLRDFPS